MIGGRLVGLDWFALAVGEKRIISAIFVVSVVTTGFSGLRRGHEVRLGSLIDLADGAGSIELLATRRNEAQARARSHRR